VGTLFRRVFLERNRLHEGIPGVQEQLPGECSWKGIGSTRLFLGLRNSFLESVPGKEWAQRRYSWGSGTASWRVFLERNGRNVGIPGVQEQL
jgi:hypothetical protein